MHLVVMGVAGSGKSTIAKELAKTLGYLFIEGDELHPNSNLEKMSAGISLQDDDRWAWLDKCSEVLVSEPAAVLACSALKRAYRDRIRALAPETIFIHLDGSHQLLMERLENRKGHFMKPQMLESQLATLENLEVDERGFAVDIDRCEADIVDDAVDQLARKYNLKVSL